MTILISDEWFQSRPTFDVFEFDGGKISLASLSDEDKELLAECETSEKMLDFAADNGLALVRERVTESDKKDDVKLFWSIEAVNTEDEPSIKHQVGKAVIELSGIADTLQDKIDEEESTALDADAAGSQENLAEDVEKLLQDKNHSIGQ